MPFKDSPSQRNLKVSEGVRRALSDVFLQKNMWGLNFETTSLAVTEVRMSSDLRVARVFVMPLNMNDQTRSDFMQGLKKNIPHIRKMLSKKLSLRVVPDLVFHMDNALDHSSQIFALLNEPKVLRDLEKTEEEQP